MEDQSICERKKREVEVGDQIKLNECSCKIVLNCFSLQLAKMGEFFLVLPY